MEKYLDVSNDGRKENVCASENIPRKKPKMSEVWNFFDVSENKKFAKCRLCKKDYKTSGNTSNLFDHLSRVHPSCRTSVTKPLQPTVAPYFQKQDCYESNSKRKLVLDNALMRMVATDVQPFSIVEDKGFQEFVKCLDPRYELPSRYTLQKVLMTDMYKHIKSELTQVMQKVDFCAITADCWTSRANEGYLTVTCHFITNELKLCTAVLSTKQLISHTSHSAENIAASLQAVFDEWGVTSKIMAIVTDNAKCMLKACEIVKKKNLPCFAHTLNLVVQDCLAEEPIKSVLVKCKRIVQYFKSSTNAYEKLKAAQKVEKPYSLIQEVPTRWNSAYDMMERLLLLKDSVSSVLLDTSKTPPMLTSLDIDLIRDLTKLLSPFVSATVQVSSSHKITISLIIPLICGLLQSLQKSAACMNTSEGLTACDFLKEKIIKRLSIYEERTATRIGTLLDPRFKKEGFRSSFNADQGAKILENEIACLCNALYTLQTAEPSTPNYAQDEEQGLFQFLDAKIANKTKTSRSDAIIKLRQYFEQDNASKKSDPLEYWRCNDVNMKDVMTCALRYFTIPATSTESERMFSKAGSIISDRRCALKPKHVDMILFINKNYWVTEQCA